MRKIQFEPCGPEKVIGRDVVVSLLIDLAMLYEKHGRMLLIIENIRMETKF